MYAPGDKQNARLRPDRKAEVVGNERAYVWRCYRCGGFLARIDRQGGVLEVYHKCGAMNRLAGGVDGCSGRDHDRIWPNHIGGEIT